MSKTKFEQPVEGETLKLVQTELIKCSSCGANMKFNPDKQLLICEHCGAEKDFNKDKVAEELNLLDGVDGDCSWKDVKGEVFKCSNCGAKVVLADRETAKVCPFCGTPHVQKSKELIGLKPNALIPFSFGVEKALEISKNWARKKAFAPKGFKKNLSLDNVKGVYTPSFTFDSYTTSVYSGKIGITHTRTVGSGKSSRVETWTEWKYIHGTYYDNFDDILITAGEKFEQKKLEKLSPYDTNASKVFEEKFMLGFSAYSYDKPLADCWQSAKNKIDNFIKKRILSQYVYDKVAYFNVSTEHDKVTYKYVMLPVYVGNFNYKQKLFNFYLNGNTGKITGKTPKSALKILILIFGIALGVVLFIILFLSGF